MVVLSRNVASRGDWHFDDPSVTSSEWSEEFLSVKCDTGKSGLCGKLINQFCSDDIG